MSAPGNILRFRKTMQAISSGGYDFGGERVGFAHAADDLALCWYWPEREVLDLAGHVADAPARFMGCAVQVSNEDTFACAERVVGRGVAGRGVAGKHAMPPLVLNFANPHTPGGGVMLGASAQEEELCRRSTLYASLTSDAAAGFYRDNKEADRHLFTHGVLVSPHVKVFVDPKGRQLAEPYAVAVMTVPAPYAKGMRDGDALREVVDARIRGMLAVAAQCGYTRLVLGAWGCGAFGNDPAQVAEAFVGALDDYGVHLSQRGGGSLAPFELVSFAVLDKSAGGKTYQAFASRMAGW